MSYKILIADDEPEIRDLLKRIYKDSLIIDIIDPSDPLDRFSFFRCFNG